VPGVELPWSSWAQEPLVTLPDAQILAITGLAILVALARTTWNVVGYPVTIVHELGHALAALSAGYRLRGITVNGDMSGATNYWSRGKAGTLWTLWWGYPAPAVVGAALIWAAMSGWARAALAVVVAGLALVFMLSRSWHTVGVVLSTGLVLGLVGWFGTAWTVNIVVFALGWLMIVGAVRGLWSVTRSHVTRHGVDRSDAYLLGRAARVLPGPFWLLTFAFAIAACAWYAVTSIVAAVS
jgi:hypothetical protein